MEQREYYRINIHVFSSLRLRKLGAKTLAEGNEFEVEVQNISGGGLCFLSDRDLPVSKQLTWNFIINVLGEQIDVHGHLVWKRVEGELFLYGVKFIFFEDQEQRHFIFQMNNLQIRLKQKDKITH